MTKNYQCKRCGTLIQNERAPTTLNCPSGGFHQWTDLGETGLVNYQCSRCAVLVKAKKQPMTLNCPEGGFHKWSKL